MAARVPFKSSVVIIAAWLIVRLTLMPVVHPAFRGDEIAYVAAARDFLSGHGLEAARRSPAYVIFLAGTLWLGRLGIFALQSAITLVAALFTQRRLGYWQGLAIAACPFFVMWEWTLLTETLCLSALWGGWLLVFWRRSRIDCWLGGVLIGFAALTRPILVLLPLGAVAILLLGRFRRAALVVLVAAYVPIALTVPQTSGNSFFGMNLWIGTWERNSDWAAKSIEDWPREANLTEQQRSALLAAYRAQDDGAFMDAALERYKTNPLSVVGTWIERYRFLWLGTRTELTKPTAHSIAWFLFKGSMWLLNAAMIVFGLLGGALAIVRRDREWVLLAPVIYIALIYIPFHDSEMRYSMPAVPFLLGLAIYFLTRSDILTKVSIRGRRLLGRHSSETRDSVLLKMSVTNPG